jgi:alkanesulfonate monooxygenase SsuD/methylene tetrahydromethanopterin reductase-like flavin-dependent oxidoreductase (luciferase family)
LGYFLKPDAGRPAAVLDTAWLLDRLGYDLIGIQDHPYQAAHLDTLSLLAVILAQTSSVRVFADVADLPMRSPAGLAKAAATLDLLSGGLFEMGIGAGGFLQAAHAMGAPAWTPAQSLAALEEAVVVMRAICGAASAAACGSKGSTTRFAASIPAQSLCTRFRSGSARTSHMLWR